jgi:hypothetical protein
MFPFLPNSSCFLPTPIFGIQAAGRIRYTQQLNSTQYEIFWRESIRGILMGLSKVFYCTPLAVSYQ